MLSRALLDPTRSLTGRILAFVLLFLSVGIVAYNLNGDAMVENSYLWDFLLVWGWETLLLGALLGLGTTLVQAFFSFIVGAQFWLWSAVLGTTGWALLMMAWGALGLYQPLPVLLLVAACWVMLARLAWTRRERIVNHLKASSVRVTITLTQLPIVVFAAGALALVYLPLLSANSVSTDAAWFHLSAAEDYARLGRLIPLPGDYAKTLPQLTSLLHLYAFIVPGLPETQRWVLAMHTEFILFLFTLLGTHVAVRQLTASTTSRWGWVAYLLFPSLYIYDSNMGGAADHIAAFFVIPHYLALITAVEDRNPRWAMLAGVAAGAAMMTKLQAVYIILPALVWCLLSSARQIIRDVRTWRGLLWIAMIYAGALTVVFAPHCLKNWLFYHNPIYPFALDRFDSRPSFHDAAQLFKEHYPPYERPHTWEVLRDALRLVVSHPFESNNPHPPQRPFIGFLGVVLAPLAFLPGGPRKFSLFVSALGSLALWAYFFPTPRNVQTFLPLLVVVAGVGMVRGWRMGPLGRLAVGVLIGLQVVMSFGHVATATAGQIGDVLRLAQSGSVDAKRNRYKHYRRSFRAIREHVPKDARLLLHTAYSQLGIARSTFLDWPGFQAFIDYRPARSPRDIYQLLQERRITHIAEYPQAPAHSRQEDMLFNAFLHDYAEPLQRVDDIMLWKMPKRTPPVEAPYLVFVWNIPRYPSGLYAVEHLDQLDDGPHLPRSPRILLSEKEDAQTLLTQASGAIIGPGTLPRAAKERLNQMQRLARYAAFSVYRQARH